MPENTNARNKLTKLICYELAFSFRILQNIEFTKRVVKRSESEQSCLNLSIHGSVSAHSEDIYVSFVEHYK